MYSSLILLYSPPEISHHHHTITKDSNEILKQWSKQRRFAYRAVILLGVMTGLCWYVCCGIVSHVSFVFSAGGCGRRGCFNEGRCVKRQCKCPRGFYGQRCQYGECPGVLSLLCLIILRRKRCGCYTRASTLGAVLSSQVIQWQRTVKGGVPVHVICYPGPRKCTCL